MVRLTPSTARRAPRLTRRPPPAAAPRRPRRKSVSKIPARPLGSQTGRALETNDDMLSALRPVTPVLIANYDKPQTIQHRPRPQFMHGYSRSNAHGSGIWDNPDVQPEDFSFHSGPDSLGLLDLIGEDPRTIEARKLVMRFIAKERDSCSSARGENHITASVVARAAAAMPHFDGGSFFFTVEQPVEVAGCSSSVQSNNRFDVSVYHQSARAAASPPQNHQPAESEPTPNHQLAVSEEETDSLLGDDTDGVPFVFHASASPEWNEWQKVICADDEGRAAYMDGSARAWWQEHLYPLTQKARRLAEKDGKKKRKRGVDSPIPEELPERWLRTHDDAVKIGAERVLLIEGKWLAKMDVEEVKYQIVSYACAIARSTSS